MHIGFKYSDKKEFFQLIKAEKEDESFKLEN